MLLPQDDIYVTLPSNVPGVPGNKPSNFKTVLPTPLKLNGAWEVALLETHYPPNPKLQGNDNGGHLHWGYCKAPR